MAHDEARPGLPGEDVLQPEDAVHVEVVGRLVQQEHVGVARQLAGDRDPLLPAGGQPVHGAAALREAPPAQRERQAAGPLGLVDRGQRGGQHVLDGQSGREDGILRHVAEPDAAADRARAPVGRLEAGQDPQQRGLARAVGAHETRTIAVEESEGQLVEERPGPVGLADGVAAQKKRARHAALLLSPSWASSSPCACRCPSPCPHLLSRSDAIIPMGPADPCRNGHGLSD